MKSRSRLSGRFFLVALFLMGGAYAVAIDGHWKVYAITESLTLRYPATWWPVSIDRGRIDIRSSKGGAEGVGIRRGQAEIIVSAQAVDPTATLDQAIERNIHGNKILSERDIKIGDSRIDKGCPRLREVTSIDEIGPDTFIVNTGIFCDLDNKRIVVLLRTWENDERLREYQHVAEKISRSIEKISG